MNWHLIVVGFLVHLVLFYSIFDIYFTSPLVHGMAPQISSLAPPAKRLVLFVADGLRADKFYQVYEDGETKSPYLRNIIQNSGTWGVSHTRVPTESRPGHVALIAGFYEDVSAVAKGWKENPVEFDSVFNQSRFTWSWGSPDILPMFSKGATGNHVFTSMYPAESEDFAGSDLAKLDLWVFDEVQNFIQSARQNQTLLNKLKSDKVVLFLHLLGLDTNGHAHKPYSDEYLENIKVVDSGVEKTVKLLEEFFADGQTAYVFTADHGMTNWGSHGAGHPSETLTPLLSWGAGVNKAQQPNSDDYQDGFQQEWKLSHVKRCDVNQADIAPLMSSLIGIAYPLNSVGILPLDYINNTDQYKAENLLTNALQLVAQYEKKESLMKATTLSVFFTPFKLLKSSRKVDILRQIRTLMSKEDYQASILLTKKLMYHSLEGLNYYQTYDRFFLGTSVVMGYLGWMAYVLQLLLREHTTITIMQKTTFNKFTNSSLTVQKGRRIIFMTIGLVVALLLMLQSSKYMYYVYCLLPVMLWNKATQHYQVIYDVINYLSLNHWYLMLIGYCIIGAVSVEILVLSFFYRELMSVGLLGIGLFPLMTSLRQSNKLLVFFWMLSCGVVAVFPMLPVVERQSNINLVMLAGFLMLLSSVLCVYLRPSQDRTTTLILIIQILIIGVSMVIVYTTSSSLSRKEGTPWYNQVLSWTILFTSLVIPSLTSRLILSRLLHSVLSLVAPFLLLSTAHEGLFCLALCYLMFFWLVLEYKLSNDSPSKLHTMTFDEVRIIEETNPRYLQLADVRRGFFFVFFVLTSFFGTGNIASINSFDPASVYCFLTVFNPFVMGTMLLCKIMIPMMMVTCTFHAIHITQQVPTKSLFLIVLLMSDLMALQFFFMVRDTGSWLEIGTSISHYVIVMCMILFIMLLLVVAKLFTTATFPWIQWLSRKTHIQ
ncbi:GPI ethanolamine phosphate transferase 1-like [Saccoglossus kowalevskii]|uniref:GPI ethanolamine phosphate transferase 1 n=1 Tax=Saccoglossus kowalevskii TaxID=10224 RepID=A0ABM0MAE5_SACKO|nr:PREDICTED: GPI ethanolamine phosphate transferase 1-like [Saccoglossus kowalevskii]